MPSCWVSRRSNNSDWPWILCSGASSLPISSSTDRSSGARSQGAPPSAHDQRAARLTLLSVASVGARRRMPHHPISYSAGPPGVAVAEHRAPTELLVGSRPRKSPTKEPSPAVRARSSKRTRTRVPALSPPAVILVRASRCGASPALSPQTKSSSPPGATIDVRPHRRRPPAYRKPTPSRSFRSESSRASPRKNSDR